MRRDRDIIKAGFNINLREKAMLTEKVKDALDVRQGHGTLLYACI